MWVCVCVCVTWCDLCVSPLGRWCMWTDGGIVKKTKMERHHCIVIFSCCSALTGLSVKSFSFCNRSSSNACTGRFCFQSICWLIKTQQRPVWGRWSRRSRGTFFCRTAALHVCGFENISSPIEVTKGLLYLVEVAHGCSYQAGNECCCGRL